METTVKFRTHRNGSFVKNNILQGESYRPTSRVPSSRHQDLNLEGIFPGLMSSYGTSVFYFNQSALKCSRLSDPHLPLPPFSSWQAPTSSHLPSRVICCPLAHSSYVSWDCSCFVPAGLGRPSSHRAVLLVLKKAHFPVSSVVRCRPRVFFYSPSNRKLKTSGWPAKAWPYSPCSHLDSRRATWTHSTHCSPALDLELGHKLLGWPNSWAWLWVAMEGTCFEIT